MTSIKYATVDVFTKTRFAGNQLAIVHVPGGGLTAEQKQAIAAEVNYSETTFVHPQKLGAEDTWIVDIYTPEQELPFAGHPTIGTAVYLLRRLATRGVVSGAFELKAGRVELKYDATEQIATASIPHDVHIHRALYSSTELLKLQPKLGRVPSQSPIVSIVKGMTFVLPELDSQDSLTFVNTTAHHVEVELDDGNTETFIGCYFYYQLPKGNDNIIRLRTRMIESAIGEDAATGSAACTLACYLTIRQQKPGTKTKYLITQGVEMGRRSDIGVDVTTTADGRIESVILSGSAVQVMEGTLSL
jgi:PhzF family phenazine biosynthesis protein